MAAAKSRFWESSSDGSESSDEEVVETVKSSKATAFDSDSEDDTKRVVKSKKDKQDDELAEAIKQLRNKMQILDWKTIPDKYSELNVAREKGQKLAASNAPPPLVYLRCVHDLDTLIKKHWETKSTLHKDVSKALTKVKQTLARYNKDNGLEAPLLAFAATADQPGSAASAVGPVAGAVVGAAAGATTGGKQGKPGKASGKASAAAVATSSSGSESSGSESGSVSDDDDGDDDGNDDAAFARKASSPRKGATPASAKAAEKKAAEKKAAAADGDDDDSVDWGSSSGSESDDELVVGTTGRYTAEMFLKRNTQGTAKKVKKEKVCANCKGAHRTERCPTATAEGGDDGFIEVQSLKKKTRAELLFPKDTKITLAVILSKLSETLLERGRRGTQQSEQMELLLLIRAKADAADLGVAASVFVLLQIVAAHFDDVSNITAHMETAGWKQCHDDVMELLTLLLQHEHIVVSRHVGDDSVNIGADKARALEMPGSVVTFIERLEEEYVKSLRAADPHATEYVTRLRDDVLMYNLLCVTQLYLESRLRLSSKFKAELEDDLGRVRMLRVDHLYYKRDSALPARPPRAAVRADGTTRPFTLGIDARAEADPAALVAALCSSLYAREGTDRLRTRAMLCHIFHHALQDRWFQARDLMLMSHLQETIAFSDVPMQVLYNRTMVQLGLCAFRAGLVQAAHEGLHDICSTSRTKELLAQGISSRGQEKSEDELKIERRRQTPFHMFINIEMLETVYFVCCMLLEIPYAAQGPDKRARASGKLFRRQLDWYCQQTFNGPPEHPREFVMAGALAMKTGDWRKCAAYILGDKMRVWGLFANPAAVKAMLLQKIKEECLRTYLFTFNGVYESIALATLSALFDVTEARALALVSKMIIADELHASHHQPARAIIMHAREPSRLQSLALQLADKASVFVENNERLLDLAYGQTPQAGAGGDFDHRGGNGYTRNARGGYRGGVRWGAADAMGGDQYGGGGQHGRGGPSRSSRAGYRDRNYSHRGAPAYSVGAGDQNYDPSGSQGHQQWDN